jgi:hypothetical protein
MLDPAVAVRCSEARSSSFDIAQVRCVGVQLAHNIVVHQMFVGSILCTHTHLLNCLVSRSLRLLDQTPVVVTFGTRHWNDDATRGSSEFAVQHLR